MNIAARGWKRQTALCLAGLALSLPALASAAAPTPSALARALEQAWRLHPQAAALEARAAEARAARDAAASLVPEPGSISFGSRNDRLSRNNLGKQEDEVELATSLWLPGQRAAREAEAASRIDEVAARRAALRSEIAGEVRDAWWALAAARNAGALAAGRLDTAHALEADVRRRYRVGELSRIDANLAQTEVHAAESDQIEADATLFQAEQIFRTLTGAAAPADLGEEMPAPQRDRREPAGSPDAQPQLAAASASAQNAHARLRLAEESRRAPPELALRILRERNDSAEPYANTIGFRLKIPFSSAAQVRRESSAAQAEADQADAEMLRTQTRVRLGAERAQRALRSSERQFALAQERRALAAENLRLAEKAFTLGESDLATLLRIRAAAYDAEALLARQQVAHAAAISSLNQALGVLP